jgi:ribonuclease HI
MVRLTSILSKLHRPHQSLFPCYSKADSIHLTDPTRVYLLRFDGGCRGNGTLSTNLSNLIHSKVTTPTMHNNLPQTACGTILTSLDDEKTVIWQQAAWLWPGTPSSSTLTSSTTTLSASLSSSSSPSSSLVPGEVAATNNTAEFIALLEGLRIANLLGLKRLVIQGDSQLIMKLTTGEYTAHKPHLQLLVQAALALLSPLSEWSVRHVPRSLNSEADALCARGFELGETVDDASTLIEQYATKCELSGALAGASFARERISNSAVVGGGGGRLTKDTNIPQVLSDVQIVMAPAWFHVASILNKQKGFAVRNLNLSVGNSSSTMSLSAVKVNARVVSSENSIDDSGASRAPEKAVQSKRERVDTIDTEEIDRFYHMVGL